jgi:cytochrome c nitrite reductase small subunit
MKRVMWKVAIMLSVLVGLAAGLGGFTFHYAEGFSYFSNDPVACTNCHVMSEQYDSWQKSSHHGRAVCNDCHTPHSFLAKYITKADNGWHHSVKFTLGNYAEPIRIRPVNAKRLHANCIECHQEIVSDIRWEATATAEDIDCVRCHAGVGHGPRS